tara:strand:+ start:5195 stop:5632 length:438 start_codon:yes stop_codon:yes gene_type:complete
MPKFQLDWEVECDFELFGVGSHVGSHRLAWELNRIFGWQLAYERQLTISTKKATSVHIVHRYKDEEDGLDVALILNRAPEGVLADGMSQLDYLLRVRFGFMGDKDIIPKIRKSSVVTLVTSVDAEKSGALEAILELDIELDKMKK